MYSPHTGYNGSLGGFSPLYLGGGRRERWRYRRMEIIVVVVGMIYSTFEFCGGERRCYKVPLEPGNKTDLLLYITIQHQLHLFRR